MRSRTLARMATETVGVEPFNGVDGQGLPSYSASQNISARVVKDVEYITQPDGSTIRISLTLWVPGDESPTPDERDRLTYDSATYIVEDTDDGERLDGTLDYTKVMARDE